MRRFGHIVLGVIIGFFFLTASVQMWGQNDVHWGNGSKEDPWIVDADGDGVHTWGSSEYGEAGKTIYYKLREGATITIKKSTTIDSFRAKAGEIIFDLNGSTLKIEEQYEAAGYYSLFSVGSGAVLTIKCSKGTGSIKGIDGRNSNAFTRSAAIYVQGILNFESGTIKDFVRKTAWEDSEPGATHSDLGCAIYIEGGTVNMTGGKIENCGFDRRDHYDSNGNTIGKIKNYGGAVYIRSEGVFNMEGGTISNCEAYSGGAVYLHVDESMSGTNDVGTGKGFNMSGGTIEGCTASYRGGAVYVGASTTGRNRFVMSGGTIRNNKSGRGGSGVCIHGLAEMNGGVIEGNRLLAKYKDINGNEDGTGMPDYSLEQIVNEIYTNGGGVFLEGPEGCKKAEFSMTGTAQINNNIACSGGGIMSAGNCTLTVNVPGEAMAGNHAIGDKGTGNGGAIYAEKSTFNFIQGVLKGNYARRYGGGININDNATLTLGGDEGICKVEGNFAGHGGGISQEAGECVITIDKQNVQITGNKARGIKQLRVESGSHGDWGIGGNGGGLFVEKGTLSISTGRIENNCAGGDGGGISLRNQRIEGNITLNISGDAKICNNNDEEADPGNGGGIDIYATKDNSVVTANILSGEISGNKSTNGAGINIYVSTEASGSSASLNIGNGSGIPEIKSNTAGNWGGGVTLENGTISINKGKIEENVAENGGGICLKTGSITVTDGYIQNNIAKHNGGGLYVVNTGADKKTVSFTGGTFTGNKAIDGGGGICVHGNIELTATGTTVNLNTAKNGGGIYLLKDGTNAAGMKYKGGLITNNTATGVPQGKTTADGDDVANGGVGGGVYLAEGTSLEFEVNVSTPFGLYGNSANFAANDIFANSTDTRLVLPNVSSMKLDGFKAPTTELYWVEDYANGDTGYNSSKVVVGTASDVYRYSDALKNMKDIVKVPFDESETNKVYSEKYICLALGYDLYYVTLVKKGLEVGESAVFDISYYNTIGATWEKYRTVLFPCTTSSQAGTGGVKVTVLLPAGQWKFVENANWSWKYSLSDVVKDMSDNDITRDVISNTGVLINAGTYTETVKNSGGFSYTFTNTSKETGENKLPASDEGVVVNKMKK